MHQLLFAVLALFLPFSFFSQETKKEDLYEKNNLRTNALANEAKRVGDIYIAVYYYEELLRRDSTDFSTMTDLAECYRLTNNYKKAEYLYAKIATSKNVDKFPESLFFLAQMQRSNGKYKEAIKTFDLLKAKNRFIKDESIKKLAKIELAGCQLALTLKDSVQNSVVTNLQKINNSHIDFSPIPVAENKLIFGSLRTEEETIFTVEEYDSLVTPSRKFFVASKQKDEWKLNGEYDGPFNLDTIDVANGTFSLDSSVFYFTRCSKNWMYNTVCSIYKSTKTASGWGEPEKMNDMINLPDFTSTHPTIGRDFKTNNEILYFVSDREGGKGGLDIWFAVYDPRKKDFKKPKNAGTKINSIGSEVTPFYDMKTKTLYYSTNGKPGLGGLDVFKATGGSNQWGESVNVYEPINSAADDLDFILKPSSKGGYFVSNREGGKSLYHSTCCDDIYEFVYNQYISIHLILDVKDDKTKECIKEGVTINVYIKDEQGKFLSQKQISSECNIDLEIQPGYQYIFEAKHPKYFTNSLEYTAENIHESIIVNKLLELKKKPIDAIVISNIQYEFNSSNLAENSKRVLDTTLLVLCQQNPSILIEISSHTDDIGSEEYNLKLSQKRAESVMNYLISKGVRKENLISIGYGETRPIASNKLANGLDNPDGRNLNRRTEFKIIGEIEPEYIDVEDE